MRIYGREIIEAYKCILPEVMIIISRSKYCLHNLAMSRRKKKVILTEESFFVHSRFSRAIVFLKPQRLRRLIIVTLMDSRVEKLLFFVFVSGKYL